MITNSSAERHMLAQLSPFVITPGARRFSVFNTYHGASGVYRTVRRCLPTNGRIYDSIAHKADTSGWRPYFALINRSASALPMYAAIRFLRAQPFNAHTRLAPIIARSCTFAESLVQCAHSDRRGCPLTY